MYSFHHIAISVSNLSASTTFYEVFGFKKVGGWKPADKQYEIINMRCGDFMLELFCFAKHKPIPDHTQDLWQDLPVVGVKHFGLHVPSIETAMDRLQAQDMTILHTDINPDKRGANFFFVKDPDGILLEVIEDNRGYIARKEQQ